MPALLFDDKSLAMSRLHEIGVGIEALQRAVTAGHAGRISSTPNDPPFIPGTMGGVTRSERFVMSWCLMVGENRTLATTLSLLTTVERLILLWQVATYQ